MAISVYGGNNIVDGGGCAEGSVKSARDEAEEEVYGGGDNYSGSYDDDDYNDR